MWLGQNAGLEVCALPPLWLSLRGRKRKLPQEAGAGTASFLPHFVGQSSQQACPDSKRLRVSWRGQGNVMMQKNTRGVPVAIFGKRSPLHSTISQIQSAYRDLSGPTGSDSCHPSLLVPFPLISGTTSPSMAPLLWCGQTKCNPTSWSSACGSLCLACPSRGARVTSHLLQVSTQMLPFQRDLSWQPLTKKAIPTPSCRLCLAPSYYQMFSCYYLPLPIRM